MKRNHDYASFHKGSMYICTMDEVAAMKRCIALAQNSIGYHHPNPKVGCIIVHNNKIIGEGFHHKYGHEHVHGHTYGETPHQ